MRPLGSYDKVQRLMGWLLRNRRVQLRNLSKSLLNIGCGPNPHPDFINLDYRWRPGLDLCWDFTKDLPFADDSLIGIYSEHTLEHVSYSQGSALLRECRRVLKPGGTLRIVVPDAELYIRCYIEGGGYPYPFEHLTTPMMKTAQIFQDHEHKAAYDFATLEGMLADSGFTHITRTALRVGVLPPLLIDSPERECESLYVEALLKP